MSNEIIKNSNELVLGYTPIFQTVDKIGDTEIEFGISKIDAQESILLDFPLESVFVLLSGNVDFRFQGNSFQGVKKSTFDESPQLLHLPANTKGEIKAKKMSELVVLQVKNSKIFEPAMIDLLNIQESKYLRLGSQKQGGTRIERILLGPQNQPESRLVVGEVIDSPNFHSRQTLTFPDRPMFCHCRFTDPLACGRIEVGSQSIEVAESDTLQISKESPLAQTAPTDYGMYTIWVSIRPEDPEQ